MHYIKYIPLLFTCLFAGKTLFIHPDLNGVGLLLVLATLTAVFELRTERKEIISLREQIKSLEESNSKSLELHKTAIENLAKDIAAVKSFQNSVKLNQTIPNIKSTNGKANFSF